MPNTSVNTILPIMDIVVELIVEIITQIEVSIYSTMTVFLETMMADIFKQIHDILISACGATD